MTHSIIFSNPIGIIDEVASRSFTSKDFNGHT